MQTFLPYKNFYLTASCLDYRRLGKQRVEAKQILNILLGRTTSKAWSNHPAVLMWENDIDALKAYYNIISREWVRRGYQHNMGYEVNMDGWEEPTWITDDFCNAHRSNLLRKNEAYYQQFNWSVPKNLPYIWPSKYEMLL